MRLFVAINFDRFTEDKLICIQSSLKMQAISANYTRVENLHLTLAFLGEVAGLRVDDVKRAMERLEIEPVTLAFSGFGSFGRGIYYAQIKRTPELTDLQSKLSANLRAEKFRLDERTFSPHVTLARELKSDGKIEIDFEPFAMVAERVSLMKSEIVSGKIVYTKIFSVLLS